MENSNLKFKILEVWISHETKNSDKNEKLLENISKSDVIIFISRIQ